MESFRFEACQLGALGLSWLIYPAGGESPNATGPRVVWPPIRSRNEETGTAEETGYPAVGLGWISLS